VLQRETWRQQQTVKRGAICCAMLP
jgi:hypothetical protein